MKSKTGGETKTSRQSQADARLKDLSKLLARARQEVLARVRVLRKEEQDDAVELPADDLDVARSLEDIETDAGLIERYEFQLKAIDAALSRLERGRYGICEKCKKEIPLERLKAVPFAALSASAWFGWIVSSPATDGFDDAHVKVSPDICAFSVSYAYALYARRTSSDAMLNVSLASVENPAESRTT